MLDHHPACAATHIKEVLEGVQHVDRVYFRAKDPMGFAKKAVDTDRLGEARYAVPEQDIEDQVAGRVLVFFRRDIEIVVSKITASLTRVEQVRKTPREHDAFAYESEHLVLTIPPYARPTGWDPQGPFPTTFEVQVRTLFMHAWAEPQHDIAYKAGTPLTPDEKRKLAWAASSAWGGDAIFEQVLDSLMDRRRTSND